MSAKSLLVRCACIAALAAPAAAQAAQATQAAWLPDKPVEVVVGVGPGGSMDRTARDVQRAFQARGLVPVSSVVVNKPGGGHSVALSYLAARPGNGHALQVVNTPFLTNGILGLGTRSHTEYTAIALLFEEAEAFAVPAGSTVKDARDLVDRLRANPAALSISISTGIGTANQLAAVLMAKAAGIDPKKLKAVAFNSAAESVTAVAGGHVDVAVTTPFSIMPLVQTGKLRLLAIATQRRMGGELAAVPTWRELGIDSAVGAWRAVIGPPKLTPAQIAYWDGVFSKVVAQKEWRDELARNYVADTYLPSLATRQFFNTEYEKYRTVLNESGMVKR